MTNAEKLRSLSDEEMATTFNISFSRHCGTCPIKSYCDNVSKQDNCCDTWLEWLRQEVQDE